MAWAVALAPPAPLADERAMACAAAEAWPLPMAEEMACAEAEAAAVDCISERPAGGEGREGRAGGRSEGSARGGSQSAQCSAPKARQGVGWLQARDAEGTEEISRGRAG